MYIKNENGQITSYDIKANIRSAVAEIETALLLSRNALRMNEENVAVNGYDAVSIDCIIESKAEYYEQMIDERLEILRANNLENEVEMDKLIARILMDFATNILND